MTTDRQFDDEADAMFVDKAREAMRPVVEDARAEAVAAIKAHLLDRYVDHDAEDTAWNILNDLDALAASRAVPSDHTTEPTDAQVLAALNAMHPKAAAPSLDYWGDKSANEMRAALRAAWTEAGQ